MATTLINGVSLTSGSETSATISVGNEERVGLRVTVTEVVADSNIRLVVKEAISSKVKGTLVVNGSGVEELHIDQVSENLVASLECSNGSAVVTLAKLDGAEKLGEQTGSIATADIEAGAVTTTKIAAGAVTAAKQSTTGIKFFRFDGAAAAGAITLTGAAVGDRVVAILGVVSASGVSVVGAIPSQFEATISVADQIQQTDAGNLSGNDYWVILYPVAA